MISGLKIELNMWYGSPSKSFAYFSSTRTEKDLETCLSDESLSLGKDFNLGTPEYEAAMLYQYVVLFGMLPYLQENQP